MKCVNSGKMLASLTVMSLSVGECVWAGMMRTWDMVNGRH
jgi:hypothetical protein